ncbi:MAG: hypothetical protein KDB03_10825 [Planctomycetales bacterium]|nr:hypothetical protein [Planctomycetales bacterium]
MQQNRWRISRLDIGSRRWWCVALSLCLLTACSLSRDPKYLLDLEKKESVGSGWPAADVRFQEADHPPIAVTLPAVPGAELVDFDQLCMTCHETYAKTFGHSIHHAQKCEDCHGQASLHLQSRGKLPGSVLNFRKLTKAERSEVCLKCHAQNHCEPAANWRVSAHAHNGVACTDCHTAHYNVPAGTNPLDGRITQNSSDAEIQLAAYTLKEEAKPLSALEQADIRAASNHLGAVAPQVCYRCHGSMARFENLAHPHQMLGQHAFTCSTCHDPHGNIRQSTRTELCLQCHQNAPTMAWHSSTHSLAGVACTDCHNPHPNTFAQQTVGIAHTNISRQKRMPMSVDEPNACYKCHPKVYAENAMPSHHPIKEGKIVCSDCHDGHGQAQGNLNQPTLNQVCYRCHADKQGPFVNEHAPVTQDCGICHSAHGTVANNLLHQPATFLCLRCHSGHRVGPTSGAHTFGGLPDTGNNAAMQQAFFSDCTQCHSQIHGSDLPSPRNPHALLR